MNFLKIIKDDLITENYKSYNALNYSLLKEIASGNIEAVRDGIPYKASTYLDFGSYIDKVIEGNNMDDVYTYKHTELSANSQSKVLVDKLIENMDFDTTAEYRLGVADKLKLWKNTKKKELRLNLVSSPEIVTILNREKARNSGIEVISKEDLDTAKYMLNVLYTHEHSRNIVNPPLKIQNLKQVAIKFKFNGVVGKVLFDFLQINTKEKTIQPIDLKTGTFYNFNKNFWAFKYWIQACWYVLAIMYLKNKYKELSDYDIKPFKFLYISREKPNLPLIYTLKKQDLSLYVEGYTNINGNYNRGIIDLVEDYKFHLDTGIYDRSREIYENKGEVNLPSPN